tara:strand:- start:180 stop:365 length:186 start_codon:yes stop_codon:yes gene_type:complete
MEQFDPVFQDTAASGVKPLISLAIFVVFGSFFLGALVTALRRGIKEEGWFTYKKEKEEDSK